MKGADKGTRRVPGRGHGDHIPALLEPGEAVLTAKAMERPGMRREVSRLNSEARRAGKDSR